MHLFFKKNKRKILVTQALPYANAPLHLGHILEAVQTDIWTRFQNFNGNECLFFCADDTHGTPVMLKANEMGIKPEKLISDVYKDHKSSYELYGINFANFYSTHSDENRKYSEYIFNLYSNIKYSIPIFPVILLDSGIIIFEFESFEAFTKHSSNVLQGIISALASIDVAAKCE